MSAPVTEQQPAEGDTNPAGEGTPEQPNVDGQEGQGEQENKSHRLEELPQWAQDHVREIRSENAQRRTEVRELQQRIGTMKTPEEVQAAIAEYEAKLAESEVKALRASVIAETGLPPELASRLQGDDEAALRADAEALKALLGSSRGPATEPTGGRQPSREPDIDDPRELAKRVRRRSF